MPDSLQDRRVANARVTRGISSGPIYDTVLGAARAHARGDVLDFGAGSGTLTALLAAIPEVTTVTAVDLASYDGEALPSKVRWLRADLNEPLPLPARSCDLIVAAEIIEHLENPRAVAREWFRLLRSGGLLVMSTPNVECIRSLLALVFRGHHLPFTEPWYPAHITPLLAEDACRVLTEAGFQGVRVGYTGHGRIPKIETTWQQVSFGALRGRRFSDNLFAVATAP